MVTKGNWRRWMGVLFALMFAAAIGGTAQLLDEIVFVEEPDSAAAVRQLEVGDLDMFAFSIGDSVLFDRVQAHPELCAFTSFGSYNSLRFNTYGDYPEDPTFEDGRLNPFASRRFREAMNWLIDREWVAGQIMGGLAVPKFAAITGAFPDYTRHQDVMEAIEDFYTYDFDLAQSIMTEEMELMGAELIDGAWNFNGAPVVITLVIRSEDERKDIGDYTADQLEALGFRTERLYRDMAAAGAYWISPAASAGRMHIYTGGWVTTIISRDQGGNFAFFYTDMGFNIPLWQTIENDPVFYDIADRLDRRAFSTIQERELLFEDVLWLAMEESPVIWLVDRTGFSPYRSNVGVAADLAGGIYGAYMWALTLHFHDGEPGLIGDPVPGGTMRLAMPSLLNHPWNPIAGSNAVYDTMPVRGTSDWGTIWDPRTGLHWAHKIDYAEITVETGLPVEVDDQFNLDLGGPDAWISLEFADEIVVPGEAWADWDAETQTWITADERFGEPVTAMRKSVVHYPEEIFTTPLHDGSTLSVGDMILALIIGFDRAQPESEIYDESAVPAHTSFMRSFKGYVIYHENSPWGVHPSGSPYVVEYYSDVWYLDAEWAAATGFPFYAQGPGFWHTLAIGIMTEAAGEGVFGTTKAEATGREWMGYNVGPMVEAGGPFERNLNAAIDTNYIPYAPTLGQYITEDEAAARYANLAAWYADKGHMWVASGPYYLESLTTVPKSITLRAFENYPYPADRYIDLVVDCQ